MPRVHELDPGLLELARAEPRATERSLIVLFPKSACSRSSSAVIVDDAGRFVGAVPPGMASLLKIESTVSFVTIIPSVDVTAAVGTWHGAKRITIPPAPSGLLLESWRLNARDCGSGAYFEVRAATKDEIETELGSAEIRWLVPVPREGQAWLDAHHRRVAEVLSTPPSRPPGDITHLVVR